VTGVSANEIETLHPSQLVLLVSGHKVPLLALFELLLINAIDIDRRVAIFMAKYAAVWRELKSSQGSYRRILESGCCQRACRGNENMWKRADSP
jgi:hypothetical protein